MIMPLAVGACCLMASLSGAALIARAWPKPTGAHRAPHPLLRPIEALDQVEAHCAHEDRITLHARLRLGGTVCMDCRNPGGSA